MSTLLHVNVSPRGNYSISRRLGDAAVNTWKQKNPTGKVIDRDLAAAPLPFVDMDWIQGAFAPPEYHTESNRKALAISDELVSELVAADQIVIASPMYNFAIPAALKAWVDHVVRAGKTFRYTETGAPQALTPAGKEVLVIVASAANFSPESGMSSLDYETPYLRFILGFIGLTNVKFILAGGTAGVMRGQVSPEDFIKPHLEAVANSI